MVISYIYFIYFVSFLKVFFFIIYFYTIFFSSLKVLSYDSPFLYVFLGCCLLLMLLNRFESVISFIHNFQVYFCFATLRINTMVLCCADRSIWKQMFWACFTCTEWLVFSSCESSGNLLCTDPVSNVGRHNKVLWETC